MNRSLFSGTVAALAGLLVPVTASAKLERGQKDLGAIWFIGDSITQSNGDDDPSGSPRKSLHDLLTTAGFTFTYTGHFSANPEGLPVTGKEPAANLYQFHSGISGSVIGDGVGGRVGMTQQLNTFWATGRLATVKPNVILIMIGANDVNSNIDLKTAPERLEKFLDAIYALPGIGEPTVFVASITPNRVKMPDGPKNVDAYNKEVPKIVKAQQQKRRDVRFVDQFKPVEREYEKAMRKDNLHPNAAGNALMAKQWFDAITDITGKPRS